MLNYKLISDDDGIRTYEYYVEGKMDSEPGIVSFGKNGEKHRIKKAPADTSGWYIGHAFSGIDTSQKEGCIAWY